MSTSSVLAPQRAQPGDYIHQPAPQDATLLTGATRIAQLTNAFSVLVGSQMNHVDAAIAEILPDVEWLGNVIPQPAPEAGARIAEIAQPIDDLIGASVAFIGRTSGYSVGRVTGILSTVRVSTGKSTVSFNSCIEIVGETDMFSRPGDSGSLVYRRSDNTAIGMVFASMRRGPKSAATLVLPLSPALLLLGATLA